MQRKEFFKVALAVVALGLAAGGCSDDERPPGSRHPAAAAVRELQEAFADEDPERICEGMTRDAQIQAAQVAGVVPTTCERDVRRAFSVIAEGGWGDSEQPVVKRVDAKERRATATVEDQEDWRTDVALAREAGTWKLSGFVGLPDRQFQELEDELRASPFPAPSPRPVEVREGSGKACPRVRVRKEAFVTGGCSFRVSGTEVPIRVLTPFGRFKISNCSVTYRVTVDRDARTWTTAVKFDNPFEHGCAEIVPCLTNEARFRPWSGRLEPYRLANYTHRTLICLRSHVGLFGGELVTHLARRGGDWQVEPSDEGTAGFKIDGQVLMRDEDFYLTVP